MINITVCSQDSTRTKKFAWMILHWEEAEETFEI